MKVVFFHRKPRSSGNYSIESYFKAVRENLPADIEPIVAESKYESNGLFRRIYNIFEASFKQNLGEVYHVTGEVHFLTYLLKKSRTVLTILDCVILDRTRGIVRWIYKVLWYTIPIKKASVITAISESTKNEILKYVKCDPNKIVVIPVFISEKFNPKIKPFNKEKPVLLQIGTAPNKNIPRLIEAIKSISCELEIVGQLEENIIELLKKNNIEYKNFINLSEEQLIERYEKCDIVTFVSTYEGFGMPIIEANAVGRAVITGNITAMPEIAGNAACLVNPFDVQSIKLGLVRIIEDENFRNELIEKGKENTNRFDQNQIVNKYVELYHSLYSVS